MTQYEADPRERTFFERALDITVRIGMLLTLLAWCFQIVRPFIVPVLWGLIIAVAVHPSFRRLSAALGARQGLAATLLTVLGLAVLVAPTVLLTGTLVDSARVLARDLSDGSLTIPLPPQGIGDWPLIGAPLEEFWTLASTNLDNALREIGPELKALGRWLLSAAAGTGLGLLQFVAAIIIAGVLLAHSRAGEQAAHSIGGRLAGARGTELADLAGATVRSVARGILGVALIQALLAGVGFLAAGVPAAGLWALIGLFLAVIQIGIVPLLIPVVIYVFYTADTGTAVAFLIWSIFVGAIDNVLKPLLLGRGVPVPMIVIFVGAIGGFLSMGIIGLFLGSIVLALGYTLFLAWLGEGAQALPESSGTAGSASGGEATPGGGQAQRGA